MPAEGFSINWIAVVAGVASFLVAYSFDWAAQVKIRGLKQTIAVVVFVLHGYALYAACWGVARFPLPPPILWIGWVLFPVSLILLIYSFFIEIPFNQTYAKTGSSNQLVTTGSYALVRHPGVIWYPFILLFSILHHRVDDTRCCRSNLDTPRHLLCDYSRAVFL